VETKQCERLQSIELTNPVRIVLIGINGVMGRVVANVSKSMKDIEIVAGVDMFGDEVGSVKIYRSLEMIEKKFDVILDFSVAGACEKLIDYVSGRRIPLVIAATGHSKEQLGLIEKASGQIPIFKAANFSLATNRFIRAVAEFARCWDGDIEIIETHHNKKIDAPSGTALVIANRIIDARGFGKIVCSRGNGRREVGEIGISAIRGGVVAGEHEVRFFSDTAEVLMRELEYGKESFAKGALEACKFLIGKDAGYYGIEELIR